jgi:hypothetical protein
MSGNDKIAIRIETFCCRDNYFKKAGVCDQFFNGDPVHIEAILMLKSQSNSATIFAAISSPKNP